MEETLTDQEMTRLVALLTRYLEYDTVTPETTIREIVEDAKSSVTDPHCQDCLASVQL